MKLAERTFKRNDYKLTSKFGYRGIIHTSNGNTASFHTGTDYGTNGEKWTQYALEKGKVTRVFTDSFGAKCVYIEYPRINKRLFYAHLDSIVVKAGQEVNNDTIIGYTGKTGKATGVHLHLGLQAIGSNVWLDPELYDYVEENEEEPIVNNNFLGERGYFKFGDKDENIGKIAEFMRKTFPAYTKKEALGDYYGQYIESSIKEFQKRTGLEQDGCVGKITLAELKKYGFKEN